MGRTSVGGWVLRLVLAPVILFGGFVVAIVAFSHLELLPTFVSPQYRGFWDDATAYQIRADGHKSLDQLYQEYGNRLVHDYVVRTSDLPGMMPSEKSALCYWLHFTVEEVDGQPRHTYGWVTLALGFFPFVYLPAVVFLNALARNYTWALVRTERAAHVFAEYFTPSWKQRLVGWGLSLPVVAGLSLFNAWQALNPDLQRHGVTLPEMTVIYVLLSYMSGLGLMALRSVIDGLFIARGVDPEQSWWDEIITIAVAGPVLVFLYGNGPVSVVADVVAGLGPMVAVRLLRRFFAPRPGRPLDVEPAPPTGREVLAGNLWLGVLLAVGGCLFCCCGGFASLGGASDAGPVSVPVSRIESEGVTGSHRWLEVTDGYLFWPKLTASERTTLEGQTQVAYYQVPLVSKDVLDEWLKEHGKGEKTEYPFEKCRVVVQFQPAELARLFPGIGPDAYDPQTPFAPYTVTGEALEFAKEPRKEDRDNLQRRTRGFDAGRLLLVVNDSRPTPIRGMILVAVALGVLAVVPLGLRFLLGGLRTRDGRKEDVPAATPPTVLPADE